MQSGNPIADISTDSDGPSGPGNHPWSINPIGGATTHAEALTSLHTSPTDVTTRRIRRQYLGGGPEWQETIVQCAPLQPPMEGPQVLKVWYVCPVDGDCQILNGDDDSLIASIGLDTFADAVPWVYQEHILNQAEVDSIHDYGNIRFRLYQADDGGASSGEAAFSWVRFEIPDPRPHIHRTSLTIGADAIAADPRVDAVTVPIGSKLLIDATFLEEGASDKVTGVTFNGVALTELEKDWATTWSQIQIWYMLNPPAITANLSVDLTGSIQCRQVAQTFDANFDINDIFRSVLKTHGDSAVASSLDLTDVVSGDYVLDFLDIDSTAHAPVPGANQTEDFDTTVQSSNSLAGSSQLGSDGGVMSWTWTTAAPFTHIAIAIKLAPLFFKNPSMKNFPKQQLRRLP